MFRFPHCNLWLGERCSRWWLLFGAIAGIGLENKHSMVFFGFATAVAVLLTPLRRELARRWIWLGAGIALLLFMPNLLWQIQNGFPTLEDLRNVRETGKNVELAPLGFIGEQILMVHPVLLPVWLAGLWFLFAGRGRGFRVIGWIFAVFFVTMLALKGKAYYLAAIYPLVLAAGGVAVEGAISRLSSLPARRWACAAVLTVVCVSGAALAPIGTPLLSPTGLVAYQERLGIAPGKTEVNHVGPLPQMFGDQFGWPELVAELWPRLKHWN